MQPILIIMDYIIVMSIFINKYQTCDTPARQVAVVSPLAKEQPDL